MLRKLSYGIAVAAFIGIVGLLGAEVVGTKPARSAVVTPKAKVKPPTVEERIADLAKGHDKILAELKEIKETQLQILELCKKIFNQMERKGT